MRITESQLRALDTLQCVRLSSDESHLRLIDSFSNKMNQSLVDYLQNDANTNDESGKTVCFLIKNENNDILAYFSLKCGLLFDREGDIEKIETKKKLSELLRRQQLLADNRDMAEAISAELKESIASLRAELSRHYQIEDNDAVHKRVAHTYSGIELAHFCVNDRMQEYWRLLGMTDNSRIGATVFWYHIVPLIIKANEFIGAEYIYLFAADTSHDAALVNYYIDKMNFKFPVNLYSVLPVYDFGCQLLYQPIENITEAQEIFFKNFNPDENAV